MSQKTAVSLVKEFCDKERFSTPSYSIDSPVGPSHTPVFKGGFVYITEIGYVYITGEFTKKQEIKNALAEKALIKLQESKQKSQEEVNNEYINTLFLVDLDNCADLIPKISNMASKECQFRIFVSMSLNLKIEKTEHIEIYQASLPVSEMVDHMMTWYACKNLNMLLTKKNVIVISKDKGLNALVEILKQNNVKANYTNNF